MEKAVIQAVITADIVNSTGLPPDTIRKLMKQLQGKLEPNVHEFYRGDSFQVLVKSPLEALSLLLQLRLIALRMSPERSMPVTDVRGNLVFFLDQLIHHRCLFAGKPAKKIVQEMGYQPQANVGGAVLFTGLYHQALIGTHLVEASSG